MTLPTYSLGISPCPNDTFIFEALIHGRCKVPFRVTTHMADVEELNTLAREGRLAITKLSMAAVPGVLDKYCIINSGAALGRGCGPLLVARQDVDPGAYATARIATPGRLTTANLLLSLNAAFTGPREAMVFDQIMPALKQRRADLGLIIHEGRFTYAARGLKLVLDLGAWWEKETGLPLPLGVIAVRRDLGMEVALRVQEAVAASLAHARAHPGDAQNFIRAHAQEMDTSVMARHIATFVNDFSENLGPEGRNAVKALLEAGAREAGLSLPALPFFAARDTSVSSLT